MVVSVANECDFRIIRNVLLKIDGKDQLKSELITNVNHALHDEEKVVNVYFTSFIIQ